MQLEKKVLDHGFVRLVSYMQPAQRSEEWSGDLEIVRNARVSYNADWRTGDVEDSDNKLIRSMTVRNHTSPFEAMAFTFEVKAPLFVFRQWHRHRTWRYNELSARYATVVPEFYIPDANKIGTQHASDKQMRDINEHDSATFDQLHAQELMGNLCDSAADMYRRLIDLNTPRELARCVLPVNVYSRMFATVDLHNLKHFLTLRQDAHAQYEIRVYADAIHDLVEQVCPLAMKHFDAKRAGDLA